ncbi:unnamed protein product, partial [Nesidiocoris tenuis]
GDALPAALTFSTPLESNVVTAMAARLERLQLPRSRGLFSALREPSIFQLIIATNYG